MKSFVILEEPIDGFSVVVFSTGTSRPPEIIASVEEELNSRRVVGSVLFDFLMSNGTRDQRYFLAYFDQHFEENIRLNSTPVSEKVKLRIADFIKNNLSQFNPSLLTPAMRFAIKRGVPIV